MSAAEVVLTGARRAVSGLNVEAIEEAPGPFREGESVLSCGPLTNVHLSPKGVPGPDDASLLHDVLDSLF